MKHYSWMAVSALLLGFMMLDLTSCSKDEENEGSAPTEKENGGKDDDKPVVVPDVVVTVDDSGQADGGHNFQKIDYKNFYIDGIKYTIENDHLVASGYDAVNFRGAAVIISTLKYQGRTMDVTSIKYEAFRNCTVMTLCVIGNKVTSIGESAFSGCSSLTSVTIGSGVTSIGDWAFYECSGLTSVTIGSGVTSIGYQAFSGCSSLTSVTIPSGVTSIEMWAFSHCSGLTSITVEKGNSKYDSRDNCNAIIETAYNTLIAGCKSTTIPSSVTSIGEGAFRGCSGLTSLIIPNSVTSIGESAFASCSGLTSLIIPNSVTSIGRCAFSYCSGLTSVTVDNGNSIYDSRENCNAIIETASNTLIAGCMSTTIPSSVTRIGDWAFADCTGLTSVTIPSSVTSIGGFAFSGCSGLQHVYCHAVNPPSGDSYSFYDTPISSATLHVPAESLDAYKWTYPWSRFGTIVAL